MAKENEIDIMSQDGRRNTVIAVSDLFRTRMSDPIGSCCIGRPLTEQVLERRNYLPSHRRWYPHLLAREKDRLEMLLNKDRKYLLELYTWITLM
jgi:hypothetical protein